MIYLTFNEQAESTSEHVLPDVVNVEQDKEGPVTIYCRTVDGITHYLVLTKAEFELVKNPNQV
jgi:hypothetical protein